MQPNPLFRGAVIVGAALLAPTAPAQNPAVSPADRATLEGSSSTTYPLGRHDCRLQVLHADLGPAPRTILGHAYRRDAISTHGAAAGFRAELSVELSIARRSPDRASRTFADNAGASPTTVLPRTSISFPATDRPGADPAPTFDFRVPYAVPFAFAGGSSTLCIDVTVHGNQRGGQTDVNFTPYVDAHEVFGDGRNVQPGYRFGSGCAASGQRAAHAARLTLRETGAGLELDLVSQAGVPGTPADPAVTAIVVGFGLLDVPWSIKPACRLVPTLDVAVTFPGVNDANGDWSGTLPGVAPIPPGTRFYTQLVSAALSGGDVTSSDGSVVTVPPPGPTSLTVVRIASGSDRTSPTGTVSRVVPVTEVY